MRQKEWRLIITFHTTAEAMACETICKRENVAGRIIPVPREISTGCGLAWCASPADQEMLEQFLIKKKIVFADIVKLLY